MSPAARSELLLAEAAFVHRLARALVRDPDLAHDVAQDALLAAHRAQQAPHSLRDWLATTARRLARRRAAAERRRSQLLANVPQRDVDDPQRSADRLRLQQTIATAVLELPEPYRTAVTLRYLDDMQPREIARRLQTGADVVRQRVHRGLGMLRQRLDGEFGDRERWTMALLGVGLGVAPSTTLLSASGLGKLAAGAVVLVAIGALLWREMMQAPVLVTVAANPATSAARDAGAAPAATEPERDESRRLAAAAPEAMSLLVVDAAGAPITDAECRTFATGSNEIAAATTGGDGRCRFGGQIGAGNVVVFAPGHEPHLAALADRSGEHRIELPEGAVVRGRLIVDGQPGAGWALRLDGPRAAMAVPAPIAAELDIVYRRPSLRTAADGSFCFRGLRDGDKCTLNLPTALLLRPESGGDSENDHYASITAGTESIDLQVTRLPGVRLRVVWSDDGAPVPAADIVGSAVFANGEGSIMMAVTGERDGTCELGYRTGDRTQYAMWCRPDLRPAATKVSLMISAAGSDGSVERTVEGAELTAREVLVELPRAYETHFLAVTSDGSPVTGARVQARGISKPTGEDGRGTFSGRVADVRAVGAPGHRIRAMQPLRPAAGSKADPLVYELDADNLLEVRFVDSRGRAVRVERVRLECADWPFAGRRVAMDLDRELRGGTRSSTWTPIDGPNDTRIRSYAVTVLCEDGVARFHSLEGGIDGVLVAGDSFGEGVVRTPVKLPQPGETRVITIAVEGEPFELQCNVTDRSGAPIVGAEIAYEPWWIIRVRTDDAGVARLSGFGRRDRVDLRVTADGFVPRVLVGVDLRAPSPIAIPLDRGQAVTVRVVDERGEPVAVDPEVTGDSIGHAYQELGAGWRHFPQLPLATVVFECRIGGVRFAVDHDSREPEALLRVPRPGHVRIASSGPWPAVPEGRKLVAVVRAIERDGEPADIWGPELESTEPLMLVPGRYRVELFDRGPDGGAGPQAERSLGRTAEFEVRAGETTTAMLR